MPAWGEVLKEIQCDHPLDIFRRKYLSVMHKYTGRNVIAYYSGFLQSPGALGVSIDDTDKNALMQAVYKLDKTKGLDLLLHTPGGNMAATESLVNYLRSIFGLNIRAFIPQIAMSGGTMIALSCKEIVMGKQSNIGPIDPQFGGMSCAGVIEEFAQAAKDIAQDHSYIPLWQAIIQKYHPTFLGDCQKTILWAEKMASDWLKENMLKDEIDRDERVTRILSVLNSHSETKSHSRHIHVDECEGLGLKVSRLETLQPNEKKNGCVDLQDCVLTIHHAYMHTFSKSNALKIVENHAGNAMIITGKRLQND